MSYFEERIYGEMGITPEQNRVRLRSTDRFGDVGGYYETEIFTPTEDDGIAIKVWDIDRYRVEYADPSAPKSQARSDNDRTRYWDIVRLNPAHVKDNNKYKMPYGGGVHPFFPPALVDKYDRAEHIETLVLTEGAFKAMMASLCGWDIVGFTSITHYADSKTKAMHAGVRKIIDRCGVRKVVMLYDGDCLNLSLKDLEEKRELTARPLRFLRSMQKIRELLIDYNIDIYFAHVMSDQIEPGHPKGLDDLLIALPERREEILRDMMMLGRPGEYFYRLNVKVQSSKLQPYFNMKSVKTFYDAWSEVIKEREFVYFGSSYKYDEKEGVPKLTMPRELKNFMRVGDDYYENVTIASINGKGEYVTRMRREKGTIKDDFGPDAIKYIPKYKAFINMPSHTAYQAVINNCYNLYSPISHNPEPGECPTILGYLRHIFEEQYEYGLDYMQLLYQKPTQMLPILCLVSKERNTGKTTMLNLLREIFSENVVAVGNSEISSEFNALVSGKLVVGVDETSLADNDKITERIKMMSTASRLPMQRKGQDHVMVDNFSKYILISNEETRFIYTQKNEVRFWVRKIAPIPDEELVPNIMDRMADEIPAFLYFLNNRRMSTTCQYRSWFRPQDLETDALRRLKEAQRPASERELAFWAKELFLTFPAMTYEIGIAAVKDLIPYFAKKNDEDVRRLLEERMGLKPVNGDGDCPAVRRIKIPYYKSTGDSDELVTEWHRYSVRRRYLLEADMFLTGEEMEQMRARLPQECAEKDAGEVQGQLPF